MKTSYFAKHRHKKNGVCIALGLPPGFEGKHCPELAPPRWLLDKYKKDSDEKFYTKQYKKEVLNKLDPQDIYDILGYNAVLLCWEGPDKFCQRHIVAKWFKRELGLSIKEVE